MDGRELRAPRKSPAMRRFSIYGSTQVGLVRRSNEDHVLLGRALENRGGHRQEVTAASPALQRPGLLFAVADGIGGEAGGAIASRLALNELQRSFYASQPASDRPQDVALALRSAAAAANAAVLEAAGSEPRLARMGCTLTGVCLAGGAYSVFNAGDSRVYRFRQGDLELLTRDDSMASLVVEAGAMTREEAARSPIGHTLTNCLGSKDFGLAVEEEIPWRDGDRLLACSDGLYGMVGDERMAKILSRGAPLDELGEDLVSDALEAGGNDNISLILIDSEP